MSRGRSERSGRGRGARSLAAGAAGWALLGTGAALLVLPGPGIPLLLAGLLLLGRERPWARKLHLRARRGAARLVARLRNRADGATGAGR